MASATGSNPTLCAKAASTTGTTAASRSSRNIRASSLRSDTIRPLAEVIENPAASSNHPNRQVKSVRANQGTATKWLDVTHMHDFYPLAVSGTKAKCVVNMFVCEPRRLEHQQEETTTTTKKLVFPVRILERHPFTPQTFIPMGVSAGDRNVRYLVIVAPTLPSSSYSSVAVPQRKRSLKERLFGLGSASRTDAYASSATLTQTSEEYHGPPRKGPGPPDLDNLQAFIARGDQAVTYGPGTWHAPMVVLGDRPIEFVVVQYSNGVANEDCQEAEITTTDDGFGLGVEIDDMNSVKAKL